MSTRDIGAEITAFLNRDPVLRELFAPPREARYRYWQTEDGWRFHYTTEKMGDGKYASAIYAPHGKGSRSGRKAVTEWHVRREVHHATRRAAKARAYELFAQHKAEIAAR